MCVENDVTIIILKIFLKRCIEGKLVLLPLKLALPLPQQGLTMGLSSERRVPTEKVLLGQVTWPRVKGASCQV